MHNGLITDEQLAQAINVINAAGSVRELVDSIPEIMNIKIASYHHFPATGTSGYTNLSQYYAYGLPQTVLDYFDENSAQRDSPGIMSVFQKGQFIWFSDMPLQSYVIEKNREQSYRDAFEIVGEGLSIPLYGPRNRKGYLFIGVDGSLKNRNSIYPYKMQSLAQLLHIRYCLLTEKMQKQTNLTPRESEVLELITFGKSNIEIGLILKISPNTVAVYVKRIFIKLDVSDRVSAAMRAQTIRMKI